MTCPNHLSLIATVDTNCQAPIPDVRALVTAMDICPLSLSQDPVAGTMVGPGSLPITVIATDFSGNTAQCMVDFKVTGPDRDGDGLTDCADDCPNDAQKSAPGACGCGVSDADANGNGTPDCNDPPPPPAAGCGTCAQGVLPGMLVSLSLMMWGRRRLSRGGSMR
jgi:hypothetical protein